MGVTLDDVEAGVCTGLLRWTVHRVVTIEGGVRRGYTSFIKLER